MGGDNSDMRPGTTRLFRRLRYLLRRRQFDDDLSEEMEFHRALKQRELEDRGCSSICIESVPSTPDWDAIRDRLNRASA